MPEIDVLKTKPVAPLTPKDIDAIVKEPDIVRRNLRVTIGYHRLSHELAHVLGYENANWCCFATWSSRHVGAFVRQDVGGVLGSVLEATRLPKGRLDALLTEEANGTLGPMGLLTLIPDSFSQAASMGNTEVFDNVARFFVGFIKSCRNGHDLHQFKRTLSPRASQDGGEGPLRDAAEEYYQALHERNALTRSQLIFAANCRVGFHEQMRLDSDIGLCVDAPIQRVLGYLVKHYKSGYDLSLIQSGLSSALRPVFIPSTVWFLRAIWQGIATRYMMQLPLPEEELFLGDDLPRLPGGRDFPLDLERLYAKRAIDVVDYFNYTAGNTLRGSGAIDWTSISERMNSIMNLFRSRQQVTSLFRTPFTGGKIKVIGSGRVTDWTDGDVPPFTKDQLAEIESFWRPPAGRASTDRGRR